MPPSSYLGTTVFKDAGAIFLTEGRSWKKDSEKRQISRKLGTDLGWLLVIATVTAGNLRV